MGPPVPTATLILSPKSTLTQSEYALSKTVSLHVAVGVCLLFALAAKSCKCVCVCVCVLSPNRYFFLSMIKIQPRLERSAAVETSANHKYDTAKIY